MCKVNELCAEVKKAWSLMPGETDVHLLTEAGYTAAREHGEEGATLYNTIAMFAEHQAEINGQRQLQVSYAG